MVHARSLLSWATLEEKKIGRGVGVGGTIKKKKLFFKRRKQKLEEKEKKNGGKNIS